MAYTPKTITANGNVHTDQTAGKYKFGNASAAFDGAGDFLSTPDTVDWDFTAHDGTIDLWVYVTSFPTCVAYFVGQTVIASPIDLNWFTYAYPVGNVCIGRNGQSEFGTATGKIATGAWYHLAFEQYGLLTSIYVNGTREASANHSEVWNNATADLHVGALNAADTVYPFNGWIDELRISNIARYQGAASFTVPTSAYTVDDNTTLLLHADGANGGAVFMDGDPAGPANLKTWNGLTKASVKTFNNLGISSVKTINGLA